MAHLELPDQPAGPLLELHGQRKRFTIPFGLKNLLEEMTRETLRVNPANIYGFLADYLEDRLALKEAEEARTGKGRHSWQWRRWSWDGSSILSNDELVAFLAEYKISVDNAQHLATIIQAAYRGFLGRKEFHHKHDEHEEHKHVLWDEWRHDGNFHVSGKDVQDILSYYGISLFEANALATKIQTVFRGYFQRRSLALTNPELAAHLQALGITHHEANKHAMTIQSLFRGYKARKAKRAAEAGEDEEGDEHELTEEEFAKLLKEDVEMQKALQAEAKRMSLAQGLLVSETEAEEDDDAVEMEKAAAKIQAGFRGMMARKKVKAMKEKRNSVDDVFPDETDAEEEETEASVPGLQDPLPKPKYEAYFAGGYDEKDRVVQPNGVELPPKFVHEHFGEIDPLAIKKKFSETEFRSKMSLMLKDLNEAKNERLKERLASRKKLSAMPSVQEIHPSKNQAVHSGSRAPSIRGSVTNETGHRPSLLAKLEASRVAAGLPPRDDLEDEEEET